MKNLWLILFIVLSGFLFATEKTFVREYTYQASDYDSKVTSRVNALEQVKTILLEEVSVFIQSEFEMRDWEEQIGDKIESGEFAEQRKIAITAGITETKILDERWTGVEYWIKAEITLDPDDLKRKIDEVINNKEKLKELEDVKKKADNALAEIERLKKELSKSKSEADQLKLTKAYNKETDVLSATNWFQKGYNAVENKEYDKAISFYLRCIELYPDAGAYYNLGIAYKGQGNLTKAIQSYEKAIELDPAAAAYYNLGNAYSKQGNYTKAIELWEKAIELDPDLALAYYNLGVTYGMQGNLSKAIQIYEKAIELDPDLASAYINLGLAYYQQGNLTKAIQYYKKAIELDPDAAAAYINLGLAYVQQGNTTKGIKLLQKAARLGHQGTQDWLKKKGYDW